jgi:hypothetical protein
MLLDRERSFNPLQQDRIQQFDLAHGEPVRHETGWLIFEDGSSRSQWGDVLEPAETLSPADRRKWQIYWAKEKLLQLAEQFHNQKEAALKSLAEEDRQKLQALHDRICRIRTNLDALENPPPPPVQVRKPTHGVRGEFYGDGQAHLDDLKRCLQREQATVNDLRRDINWRRQRLSEEQQQGASIQKWDERLEARQQRVEDLEADIADHEKWLALPFWRRKKINERLAQAERENVAMEARANAKRRRSIAAMTLPFVEEEGESFDEKHDAAVRQETAAWHEHAAQLRERDRQPSIEQAARDENAEAEREAAARHKRPAKKARS